MAYTNHLLFNNVFLKNIQPLEEELAAARYLVHESARDWYRDADLSSPASIAETWLQPLLNQQSLDLTPCDDASPNAWYIVAPWDRSTPLALCYVAPQGTDLNGYVADGTLPKGQHWMIKAVNLTHRSSEKPLRWTVLTNGVQWRLLDARALRRYEAYLEVDLHSLLNGEDDVLAAYLFYRLFRYEDAFELDGNGNNCLDAFLERSTRATEATEIYLKTTVSDNLNTPGGGDGIMAQLCIGIVHAIDPTGTRSFTDSERSAIYRDATYLLYRLLFILYAEARNLLPSDRPDYQAVSLRRILDEATQLRGNPNQLPEKPTSLWEQLNTLFNAIHYSDEYLGIPPYNGGLFENKDKPYLSKATIENTYLAEALYELSYLPDRKGEKPPERIDYRDLSVRHLGSLYEGMIEYQLFIAEEELLARRDKDGKVKYLSLAKNDQKPNDEVVKPGKVYFAQSSHERKATGTHYTAEDLVARLVRQTVERLLEERWKAFEPKFNQWLNEVDAAPDEATRRRLQTRLDSELEAFVRLQVLSLRICDPAMGSGHFLVYIAHTLVAFILQTLSSTPWENSAINLDPQEWRRLVVENCLFGVDVNEMAVELSKLSLWLATMQVGRPLSFLDHHLKQGNSLLGASLDDIEAIVEKNAFNQGTRQTRLAEERGQYSFRENPKVQQKLAQVLEILERIATRYVERVADVEAQEADNDIIQTLLKPYKQIGDLLVAQKMGFKVKDADLRFLAVALEEETVHLLSDQHKGMLAQAKKLLGAESCVHWSLEFPQIFLHLKKDRHGFDAMIGNPPFLGGARISTQLGDGFLRYLKGQFFPSEQNTDLCAYFFRQGYEKIVHGGYLGMIATNTVGEGDTRIAGLAPIISKDGAILFVDRYVKWPGDATVEVNLVALGKPGSGLGYSKAALLDGEPVGFISSWLDDLPENEPQRLFQNKGKAFQGSVIYGTGFLITLDEAEELIRKNRNNEACIFPFLIGRDVNTDSHHAASRGVIYFHNWTLGQAEKYPDLLEILKLKVKPVRDRVKRKQYREKWWLFAEDCVELKKKLPYLSRVLVRSRVSELHMITFVPKEQVFSDATIVFSFDDFYHFALLQSSHHEIWLRRQASSLRTDIRYTSTTCFQTFPFPQSLNDQCQKAAEESGKLYYVRRKNVIENAQSGLTKTYNFFHDPDCRNPEIEEMRRLHAEMDRAVLACYGWDDIDLNHNFYLNDRKKPRYMPSRDAQREIFTRLLNLNKQIAAQEMAQGMIIDVNEEDEEVSDEE